MNKTIIAIVLIVMVGLVCTVNFYNNDNEQVQAESVSSTITIIYSDDTKTALVSVPYRHSQDTELLELANTISSLYDNGYEYVGMYQTDTGSGMAHFIDILIFRKESL